MLFAPVGVRDGKPTSQADRVAQVLEHQSTLQLMDDLRADRPSILASILALRKNYPRPAGGYRETHVRDFAARICFQQAVAANLPWVEARGGASFDLDATAFPSVKSMAYSVFFRFYVDRDRQPRRSDVLDIAIASALPYVEMAALEKDQGKIVKERVKGVDPFLMGLKVWTFRDLTKK